MKAPVSRRQLVADAAVAMLLAAVATVVALFLAFAVFAYWITGRWPW